MVYLLIQWWAPLCSAWNTCQPHLLCILILTHWTPHARNGADNLGTNKLMVNDDILSDNFSTEKKICFIIPRMCNPTWIVRRTSTGRQGLRAILVIPHVRLFGQRTRVLDRISGQRKIMGLLFASSTPRFDSVKEIHPLPEADNVCHMLRSIANRQIKLSYPFNYL